MGTIEQLTYRQRKIRAGRNENRSGEGQMASMDEFKTVIGGTVCRQDKISRATGRIQEWFRRLDRKQLSRDLNVCTEERRMERVRIASELHDTLLQGFLGASLVLYSTLEQMPEDAPTKPSLSHAVRLMQHAIDEGRGVLQGLRSSVGASTSLEQAFSGLLNEFAQAKGVRFRILVMGQPKTLKPAVQQQIYLIGREALVMLCVTRTQPASRLRWSIYPVSCA